MATSLVSTRDFLGVLDREAKRDARVPLFMHGSDNLTMIEGLVL